MAIKRILSPQPHAVKEDSRIPLMALPGLSQTGNGG
jgi:hypothetical protein